MVTPSVPALNLQGEFPVAASISFAGVEEQNCLQVPQTMGAGVCILCFASSEMVGGIRGPAGPNQISYFNMSLNCAKHCDLLNRGFPLGTPVSCYFNGEWYKFLLVPHPQSRNLLLAPQCRRVNTTYQVHFPADFFPLGNQDVVYAGNVVAFRLEDGKHYISI